MTKILQKISSRFDSSHIGRKWGMNIANPWIDIPKEIIRINSLFWATLKTNIYCPEFTYLFTSWIFAVNKVIFKCYWFWPLIIRCKMRQIIHKIFIRCTSTYFTKTFFYLELVFISAVHQQKFVKLSASN